MSGVRTEAAARALHASAPVATASYDQRSHLWEPRAVAALAAADASDRERNIYRVEVTEETIERVAREMWRHQALGTLHPHYKWDYLAPEGRERLLVEAREVLLALTDQPSDTNWGDQAGAVL